MVSDCSSNYKTQKEAILISKALTKGSILSLASNADVFSRGEIYYHSGKVVSISIENGASANVVVAGNYRNYNVTIKFDRLGKLEQYECDCQSTTIWDGACKHIIASLLAILEEKNELSDQSANASLARKLADNLEKQIYKEIDESFISRDDNTLYGDKLHIEPKLYLNADKGPFLNFYVGNNRMYIMKNINEFVTNISNQAMAAYGAKLQFRHSIDAFDGDSQGLLEFIINENAVYHEISKLIMNNYNYMFMTKENARNLALNERNADDFFNLFMNKTLDTDIGEVKVLDKQPPISFEVDSKPGEILLKWERFNIVEISGRKYKYILAENIIYRIDKNRGIVLSAIAKSFNTTQLPQISFKNSDRVKFISIILPYLKRERLISCINGELEIAAACPMSPKLYFDADAEDNYILCRIAFFYGDVEINPVKQQDTITYRDLPYEYRIMRHLRMYGFEPDEKLGMYKLTDSDCIYRLLYEGLEHLAGIARIYAADKLIRLKPKPVKPKVGITLSGNLLEINMDESEFSFLDLIDALDSVQLKKKYHRLKDGRFINLEDENTQAVTHFINSLDLSKNEVSGFKAILPKYRSLYIDQLAEGIESVNRGMEFQELASEFRRIKDIRLPQPDSLHGILREYQKTGFNWLSSLSKYGFGGVLADDMGLGKTIQVIAFLLSIQTPGKQSLVVAPASLIFNWENELNRFAPSLTAQVVTGTPEKRIEILDTTADIYITTYDLLKRDIDFYKNKLFETLIADEAQYIKNPQTQNAKAIKSVKSKNRFALTGTPIENSLTELWSIFDFILPGYLYSLPRFTRLYEAPIVKDGDNKRAEALRKQISPFLLRRLKGDVLTELPEKTETNLYAELLPEQKRIYHAYLVKARGSLDLEGGILRNRMKIFAELTRLRQICCHPALFIEDYAGGSGKLLLALETIQMTIESGHRLLLFSQFTSMLSILKKELNMANISYFYLDGSVSSADRLNMANRFNNGERSLFLISLRAGGTDLNLTGADIVIHYDPWWNPAVMNQASDRAHRFGQKEMVQVFNLVTHGTIEQKIMELHDKKKDLADSVISEGGQFLSLMSEAEIIELFALV